MPVSHEMERLVVDLLRKRDAYRQPAVTIVVRPGTDDAVRIVIHHRHDTLPSMAMDELDFLEFQSNNAVHHTPTKAGGFYRGEVRPLAGVDKIELIKYIMRWCTRRMLSLHKVPDITVNGVNN